MKILIISEYNLATTIGGTETYVDLLIKGIAASGNQVVFITQGDRMKPAEVEKRVYHSSTVYFLPQRNFTAAEMKQEVVSSTWLEISAILQEELPDIIHVHTLSTFFNHQHLLNSKQAGFAVAFTTHVPGHFCSRGDLIRNGVTPCDGVVGLKCIRCAFSTGLKAGVSSMLKGYYKRPKQLLHLLNDNGISLICVAEWQKAHAVLNGFAENRITVIRQACPVDFDIAPADEINSKKELFRIGYLGRLSPEKGSGFLLRFIELMCHRHDLEFVLGIPLNNSNKLEIAKLQQLKEKAGHRLHILTNITAANKSNFFNEIDCLLIPSFFWETGPIVLLEALSYCKQILVPDIGGTAEYAAQFPGSVSVYEWQNELSAERQIAYLQTQVAQSETCIQIRAALKQMEETFITKHLSLYQEMLVHNQQVLIINE